MQKIISGFPGIGKSVFAQNSKLNVIDLDSSEFSHHKDGSMNLQFPRNYVQSIKRHYYNADYILVSTHREVRQQLELERLKYTLVYPSLELKEEYLLRYKERDSSRLFIDLIADNWSSYIRGIEKETYPELIRLKAGEYLSDLFKEVSKLAGEAD